MTRPFLTAEWRWLVMVNWPVDPARLAPLVPRGIELDEHQGQTFLSLVGFLFLDTRVRGWAIPGHRNFEEVNLRYYVRRHCQGELRRGVMFVQEIVPRRAIAWVARHLYNENYVALPMRHQLRPGSAEIGPGDSFQYQWRYERRWHGMSAVASTAARLPDEGSLSQFIAEHYWGYCAQRDGSVLEYQVQHPPWRVAPLDDVRLDCDFNRLYGSRFADFLCREPASAFVADGSAVQVYPGGCLPDAAPH